MREFAIRLVATVRTFGGAIFISAIILVLLTLLLFSKPSLQGVPTATDSMAEAVQSSAPIVGTVPSSTDGSTSAPGSTAIGASLPIAPGTVTDEATTTDTPAPTMTPMPTDTATPTCTPTSSSTPTPSATPTPTTRPPSVEILADELTVRTGPGTKFKAVYTVHKGDYLIAMARNLDFEKDPWFLIGTKDGHQEWISGDTRYVKQYNVDSLAYIRGPATATPIPPTKTPTPVVLASNVRDFSTSQGATGWKYLVEDNRMSGRWREMTFGEYSGKQCWLRGQDERDVRMCRKGEVNPGVKGRVAYEWKPNVDRQVRIQVQAHKNDNGGDGVSVETWKVVDGRGMVERLGRIELGGHDTKGVTRNYNTRVGPGILIYIIVDIDGNSEWDATQLSIDIY